jgi:hypothetical protein
MQPGSGQRDQAAQIVAVHKMPRGPQNVGPQDPPVGHSLFDVCCGSSPGALRKRPAGIGEFLRLHSQEVLECGLG